MANCTAHRPLAKSIGHYWAGMAQLQKQKHDVAATQSRLHHEQSSSSMMQVIDMSMATATSAVQGHSNQFDRGGSPEAEGDHCGRRHAQAVDLQGAQARQGSQVRPATTHTCTQCLGLLSRILDSRQY